jgi:hypothetical protein
MADLQRPRALFKARFLLDADRTIEKARKDARDKEGLHTRRSVNRVAAGTAGPAGLKRRVAARRATPQTEIESGDEKLVATAKYALGLEGGSEGSGGLPPELFVELLEYLVQPRDSTRRGMPLGGEEQEVEEGR